MAKHRLVFIRDATLLGGSIIATMLLPFQKRGHTIMLHIEDWHTLKRIAADSNGRIEVKEEK